MPPSAKSHFRKTTLGLFLAAWAGTAWAQPVQVSGAWVRATAPGQDTGAAYLTLRSEADDTLLSVASADAGSAMLHRATQSGSMRGMQDMDSLPVLAGQSMRLAPGGMHIMLMNLKHRLVAGGRVGLDLTFRRAGMVHVVVPVQPIQADGPPR